MKKTLSGTWTASYNGRKIQASVPGDLTIDCYKAGLVSNPYYAENYKDSTWVGRTDFTYSREFEADSEMVAQECIELVFKGIDLYADVFLNGKKLGSCENMFRAYRFDITKEIHEGKNRIEVQMHSTLNAMDKMDCTGYASIFNVPRIFTRKAQCHFGWDWAPKICGYGIWDDVYIETRNKFHIEDVQVVADDRGNLSFFTEINYNLKPLHFPDDSIAVPAEKDLGDVLRMSVSTKPSGEEYVTKEIKVIGKKNFGNFVFKNPELWWPIGYGDHPLYNYRIELVRDGKVIDVRTGRFAFRSVALEEKPVGDDLLGFKFLINGVPVYVKGSNWVPIECFTGVVEDEKYRKITDIAKNGNINTLRVWGGGIYEKDIFYDLCDEKGLMVWQDIMLACADIPEEKPEFMSNFLAEVEYQVRRLRNHPSVIYWCGGNEKTGCYGLCINHGDFLVNNILYGFIKNLDDTRPYRRQSPFSHTDIGNDKTSGESHSGSAEDAITYGMDQYRKLMNRMIVPFASETAIMGPSSSETLRKIFPEDHLWPMDEMWRDRFMDNPYSGVHMDFPHRELKFASELYGEPSGFEDFVKKAMMYHGEIMRAEIENSRCHKGITWGFMNWMFSDIWPSGTWSIIDYFLEPKEAYYAMKQSFRPKRVSFFEDKDGRTEVFAVNDTLKPFTTTIKVSVKTFGGETLYTENVKVRGLGNGEAFSKVIDSDKITNDVYLVAEYTTDGEKQKTLYSPDFCSNKHFESDFDYQINVEDDSHVTVTIKAKSYVRALYIHFKDNYKYVYSDNYMDIEAGDSVTVSISSDGVIDPAAIQFDPYH